MLINSSAACNYCHPNADVAEQTAAADWTRYVASIWGSVYVASDTSAPQHEGSPGGNTKHKYVLFYIALPCRTLPCLALPCRAFVLSISSLISRSRMHFIPGGLLVVLLLVLVLLLLQQQKNKATAPPQKKQGNDGVV